jgi:EAL domain
MDGGTRMSFMVTKTSKFDLDPRIASPLDAAISAQDRETLSVVATALQQRRMRLAFQPVVYAADPSVIGFFEGYIRLLNQRNQVIPAQDFMGAVEHQELGREIDCAALQLGLMVLQRNPQTRISVNMSARSVGYQPWVKILRKCLRDTPKLAHNLILEINEASALQVPDVLKPFMAEMRGHGIVFALDDFGAGMTSLRRCRHRSGAGNGDVSGRRSGGDGGRGQMAERRRGGLHAGLPVRRADGDAGFPRLPPRPAQPFHCPGTGWVCQELTCQGRRPPAETWLPTGRFALQSGGCANILALVAPAVYGRGDSARALRAAAFRTGVTGESFR